MRSIYINIRERYGNWRRVNVLTRTRSPGLTVDRKIERELPLRPTAGYYSSLVVSRNSLRFSFAPLSSLSRLFRNGISVMSGHVLKMRYPDSTSSRSPSLFPPAPDRARFLATLDVPSYLFLFHRIFLIIPFSFSLAHESHPLALIYRELSIRDAPRQNGVSSPSPPPFPAAPRAAPFGEYIMQ